MKHTNVRWDIRKHPFIIAFIIIGVIAVAVTVGYIDINHRFPKPTEEIAGKNEWVQYSDGIKIKAAGIEYCTDKEINEKYKADVKENGNMNYIAVNISVMNESQEMFNIYTVVSDSNLVIYPDGYENQGMPCGNDIAVDKGETKDFTLAFTVPKKYIGEKKVNKLLKEDIYLCFKAYPVRQAIVFNGIDN